MDSGQPHGPDIPEISVHDLKKSLEDRSPYVLVDVREPFERRIADLPAAGQRRIPLAELEGRIDELDPDDALVLYCRTGVRSAWATRHLQARGFERVWNLKGGVMAWREEIDPSLQAY